MSYIRTRACILDSGGHTLYNGAPNGKRDNPNKKPR